ncbi:MAG: hypothetical protein Q8N21_04145 [bacterium]|nr:hypothetical protein [bacterium]
MDTKKYKCAFVTNIIEDKDIRLKVFYPRLGYLIPLFVWRHLFILRSLFGKGYSCVASYDVFGKVIGYTIIIEITAKQCVSKRWIHLAKKLTLKACLYAQNELHVDMIGLGSVTKSITSGGRFLKQNGVTIPVTHGDAYSVASGIKGVEMMIECFKFVRPVISVIGAYGKIGRAITLILTSMGYKVIAMARDKSQLEKLRVESGNSVEITSDSSYALNNSQIAIMVTSAPYSVITEHLLQKGKIYYLYDMGQPHNLFENDYWRLIKKGYEIVRVDGGFETVDRQIDIDFWMRLKKGTMYACFVEMILQALTGDMNDYVGIVKLDHVDVTRKRAIEWGFRHCPLTCYSKPLKLVVEIAANMHTLRSGKKFQLAKIASLL